LNNPEEDKVEDVTKKPVIVEDDEEYLKAPRQIVEELEYYGCFNDKPERALPYYLGDLTAQECLEKSVKV